MSVVPEIDDGLRLVTGFRCKDGEAKETALELAELEGALRLTICGDAIVNLTPVQAKRLRDDLSYLSSRIERRAA